MDNCSVVAEEESADGRDGGSKPEESGALSFGRNLIFPRIDHLGSKFTFLPSQSEPEASLHRAVSAAPRYFRRDPHGQQAECGMSHGAACIYCCRRSPPHCDHQHPQSALVTNSFVSTVSALDRAWWRADRKPLCQNSHEDLHMCL